MDLKIVVDSREYSKMGKIANELEKRGVNILVEKLYAGDYYVQGEFLVERKTPLDLVGSVKKRRIWEQAEKLKLAENVKPLILIEGYPTRIRQFSDWGISSYLSICSTLIFSWRIPLYFTPNWRWTVDFLMQLAKYAVEEGKEKVYPVSFKPKAETPKEMKRRVVESLPMIGPKQALVLLNHFKTVRNIINSSVDELMKVKGIGRKKAETIYRILNEKY